MTVTNGPQLGVMVDAASGDSYPNDLRRALRALDAHLYFSAKSATTAAQPGSPADGDRYILPTSPTGTQWAGKAAGTIAVWTTRNTITSGGTESTTSTWEFFAPKRNWIAFVEDASDALIRYTGSVWTGNLQTAEDISRSTGYRSSPRNRQDWALPWCHPPQVAPTVQQSKQCSRRLTTR